MTRQLVIGAAAALAIVASPAGAKRVGKLPPGVCRPVADDSATYRCRLPRAIKRDRSGKPRWNQVLAMLGTMRIDTKTTVPAGSAPNLILGKEKM